MPKGDNETLLEEKTWTLLLVAWREEPSRGMRIANVKRTILMIAVTCLEAREGLVLSFANLVAERVNASLQFFDNGNNLPCALDRIDPRDTDALSHSLRSSTRL